MTVKAAPTTHNGIAKGAVVPSQPEQEAKQHEPLWWPAAIQALALSASLVLLLSLWLLARPLALLLAGGIIASAIAPLVHRLERRLPLLAAILLIYLAALLVLTAIGALVLPTLIDQARSLFVNGPDLIDRARQWIDQRGPLPLNIDQIASILASSVDRFSSFLISLPLRTLSAMTEILVVVIMSMYWLIAAAPLQRFALSLVAPTDRAGLKTLLRSICDTMGGYVRATVVDMLVIALVVYVGLLVFGVKYALLLAIIAGLGALIPVIGPIISAIPALAVALAISPVRALIVLLFYLVVHQLESDILLPNLMKKQADIPPLLVLFALLAAGATGSILAVLIAIPLAGAARVVVMRVVAPAIRRRTGAAQRESEEAA